MQAAVGRRASKLQTDEYDTAERALRPPSTVLTVHGIMLAPLLSDVEPQWLPARMVICRHRSFQRDSNNIPTCTSSAYQTSTRNETSELKVLFQRSFHISLVCTDRLTCGCHCLSVTQEMRSWLQRANGEQALSMSSTSDACMQQEHRCYPSTTLKAPAPASACAMIAFCTPMHHCRSVPDGVASAEGVVQHQIR